MKLNNVNLGLAILATLLAIFSTISVLTKETKVAYVDSVKLMDGYDGMKKAREAYKKKASQWQANVDTLTKEVQLAIMDYEKQVSKMTKIELSLTKEVIKNKQEKLANYQRAIQSKAQQEDAEMTQQVLTRVNGLIKDYGKANGYQVIFGANGSGNIIYAVDAMDITDEVLKVLNSDYNGL